MIELMNHNKNTYNKLVKRFETTDTLALVQATGTGKSYIALKYIEDFYNTNPVLIIVPTTLLADYWEKQKLKINNNQISIITYASLIRMNIDELLELSINYSLIVLDEVHRAGAEKWGAAIKSIIDDSLQTHFCKILGLTATPIRSLDNNRDIVEELFIGNQVYGITLKNALISGVLPPFSYVAALYNLSNDINITKKQIHQSKYISSYDKSKYTDILNNLLINDETSNNINNIINKHIDISANQKIVVFTNNINDKENLLPHIATWFPSIMILNIDGEMSDKHCAEQMDVFNNTNDKSIVLVVVNKLNEGVHIEGITGLIMLRKTSSNIVFFQQLGRALDASNKTNKIVVFDFVSNHKNIKMKEGIIETINQVNNNVKKESCEIIVSDYTIEALSVLDDIENRISRFWTDDEDIILKTYYPSEGYRAFKRLPNRTRHACINRVKTLNILCDKYENDKWTTEEDNILINYYPTEGTNVFNRLPNRTEQACIHRLSILHVYIENKWTPEEDDILYQYYVLEGYDSFKRLPGRTTQSCSNRANFLNLRRRKPIEKWTPEEDDILYQYFIRDGVNILTRLPNRSLIACRRRAIKLKIEIENQKNLWTDEENNILIEFFKKEGDTVCERLTGRTPSACHTQAKKLKLLTNPFWTDAEKEILINFYPTEGGMVEKRLENKTYQACLAYAKRHKIKRIYGGSDNK